MARADRTSAEQWTDFDAVRATANEIKRVVDGIVEQAKPGPLTRVEGINLNEWYSALQEHVHKLGVLLGEEKEDDEDS